MRSPVITYRLLGIESVYLPLRNDGDAIIYYGDTVFVMVKC